MKKLSATLIVTVIVILMLASVALAGPNDIVRV